MNWLQKISEEILEMFKRYSHNPILSAEDWPYSVNSVFNAGAVKIDEETVLLCRVEDRTGLSHFCVARSHNGQNYWKIDEEPSLDIDPNKYPEEEWGIEDPRIVWMPELDKFAITHTGYSKKGPCVCLTFTKDFKSFDKQGSILPPTDKNAAIFPEKINGKWAILHRPGTDYGSGIQISYSDDLKKWKNGKTIMLPGEGPAWDTYKIGIGPPPIETDEGWLLLYHGTKEVPSGLIYRVGVALLDLKDPSKCIKRCSKWVLSPKETYELSGDTNNVVFPCGYTLDEDTVNLYYGAADSSICLAQASIKELLSCLD